MNPTSTNTGPPATGKCEANDDSRILGKDKNFEDPGYFLVVVEAGADCRHFSFNEAYKVQDDFEWTKEGAPKFFEDFIRLAGPSLLGDKLMAHRFTFGEDQQWHGVAFGSLGEKFTRQERRDLREFLNLNCRFNSLLSSMMEFTFYLGNTELHRTWSEPIGNIWYAPTYSEGEYYEVNKQEQE